MAFDDFESRDADPTTAQGLDEDLFDFPLVDPFGVAEEVSSPAPARTSRTKASTRTATPPADADDDDLFASPLGGTAGSLESFEDDVDRLSERVADLIEDDDLDSFLDEPLVEDDFGGPPVEEISAPAQKSKEQKRPKRVVARESAEVVVEQPAQLVAAVATPHSGPFRLGRTGMLIAAGASLFAFALLGVVWHTGRGMQAALASRSENANEAHLQSRIMELEQLMNSQRQELLSALESKTDDLPEIPATHVRVEPEWFVERKLIQQAMAEGRYREARKRLFALQAVMDDLGPDVRDELAPTVAFLIPETYRLQAADAKGGEE
ncbi:MAG: hypothetical protein H6831_11595 [Planctomycetes bacterium]|nr:hypothetical protein [Planctomycetota bacterium]MCB9905043.1 hypothetical protein [Planctomycetota bacterium]